MFGTMALSHEGHLLTLAFMAEVALVLPVLLWRMDWR